MCDDILYWFFFMFCVKKEKVGLESINKFEGLYGIIAIVHEYLQKKF